MRTRRSNPELGLRVGKPGIVVQTADSSVSSPCEFRFRFLLFARPYLSRIFCTIGVFWWFVRFWAVTVGNLLITENIEILMISCPFV